MGYLFGALKTDPLLTFGHLTEFSRLGRSFSMEITFIRKWEDAKMRFGG